MNQELIQSQPDYPFDPASLKRNPRSPRTLFGLVMTGIATLFTVLAIIPLLIILSYLLTKGISSLSPMVFTELPPPPLVEGGGFGNAILGTVIMVGIGAAISVPIGIMAAIYLSEFSQGKLAEWIRFATNVLSGVPSIIIGVFAYSAIVLTTKSYSAWAGGFALAILMLPIIIRTTDEALKLVPQEVRQASVGIGANDYQTVLQVVLPAAIPAIITGITLAIARAAGETAPLLFTALFTQYWPNWNNLLVEPTASLAVLVYNFAIVPFKNQQELAWGAAFILVLLVLLTSVISRIATARRTY
ncbi:phosphate ABC transporter membrane protein 2, PhoT family [Stanieria cyanosphaera PCC 7437]|uniref:Phosphate transport system permease protein PstA n=1 Tax=Stanieria cyanosphaera (strain ATCC 29371 / PCC 7437) TaxID=111780 RepID=K9XS81_STAC7|nr:phosphate ABC transporter permease PstA [Stanieria cyanosphaera]AFZ34916.1 phosphate ABC transporter membrane protein 2, PhoT family [Stanieria cyanosphaera PCC 7437]